MTAAQATGEVVEIPFVGPPLAPEDAVSNEVQHAVERLRVQQAARELFAREQAADTAIPAPISLADLLDTPDDPVQYRMEELWPKGGRVVFAASKKSGKTTATGNAIRCLADGGQFLGRFQTEQVRRVTLIDNELDPRMLKRWLRDHGIHATERVQVVTLRGHISSFNILEPQTRARWAQRLRGSDVVILDCLRPVLDALGLDENREAGRFLVAFDELLDDAEVDEAMVVHHMGHSGERSRGDSRIVDWPDALWKIVREDPDDDSSARYFSAFGRDVEVHEGMLDYNPATRELTLDDVSRKAVQDERRAEQKAQKHAQREKDTRAVIAVVREAMRKNGGVLSGRAAEKAVRSAGLKVTNGDGPRLVEAARNGSDGHEWGEDEY
ncbi:AAA family ATPase [Rhodococcus sp. ABRD24]|uniref:AAA family ATPase n=1 Tax=Rhodococcus sp. ABRD24 TaxID=2507582 RepID=UPI00103B7E36|nr:AAA family ATPase [Rhodococcus sp. ABRD24]QBJ94750.1 AAA family ATPase [Rhodococcus sp. ABRD24]